MKLVTMQSHPRTMPSPALLASWWEGCQSRPSKVALGEEGPRRKERVPLEHLCAPGPARCPGTEHSCLGALPCRHKPHFSYEETEAQEGRSLAQGKD